jgi:hypothetical protein
MHPSLADELILSAVKSEPLLLCDIGRTSIEFGQQTRY